jgi:phage terminase large subunit GpA-like protein
MTRTFTSKPVWTWQCDRCGIESSLALSQSTLPSGKEMEDRGWYIAPLFGDLCPHCNNNIEVNA